MKKNLFIDQSVKLFGSDKSKFYTNGHNTFMMVFMKSALLGVFLCIYTIIFFINHKVINNFEIQVNYLLVEISVFLFISYCIFLAFYLKNFEKSILISIKQF